MVKDSFIYNQNLVSVLDKEFVTSHSSAGNHATLPPSAYDIKFEMKEGKTRKPLVTLNRFQAAREKGKF